MKGISLTTLLLGTLWVCTPLGAQSVGELSVRLTSSPSTHRGAPAPAVIWLQPEGKPLPFTPDGKYTLMQKNRTFVPHLQVVPVGSTVRFPNVDPFFHNVFSLFDGRRFDLGLYEAGSSKSVAFTRPGISYIFCNIHPEMSAVIIALTTPLFTIGQVDQPLQIHDIPPGDYSLHFWIEGTPQADLDRMTRKIDIHSGPVTLGDVPVSLAADRSAHNNKFGVPYHEDAHKSY